MAHLIELKPNRMLLDPNFDGYKLSLKEMLTYKRTFDHSVDRQYLDSSQFSILHTKLFGFHNHLFGDQFDENGSVYFIDEEWNINKVYMDSLCDELTDSIRVWQIPKNRDRNSDNFNVSMIFASTNLAIIADGTGFLYIVQTGSRENDDKFTLSFSEEVAGPNESFVILNCSYNKNETEQLDVLLLSLKQEHSNKPFLSFLHLITMKRINSTWTQTALKQMKTKGSVQYAAIEKHLHAIYIVSDSECEIFLNSDNPIIENYKIKTQYEWSQTPKDISIYIELAENTSKESVNITHATRTINIELNNEDVITGSLYETIDSSKTTWIIEDNNLLITLNKEKFGLIWPELILGDKMGKEMLNSCDVHDPLAHLTHKEEIIPQTGIAFNSQQVEECDFESDKTTTFQRICCVTNTTTHRINFGSHQVLLTAQLNNENCPAIGIRYDVDICLWQPNSQDSFTVNHEGTLLALGYIQASKQNRKFLACPPSMEYAVICESSGHIFIYRQKKKVNSGELRNRSTGQRVRNIAEQQVLNITNDEILGIYAHNNYLFLLCKKYLLALKL